MEEIDQAEVERIAKFFNDRCFTCGGTKKIRIEQPCPDCMEIDITPDLKHPWEGIG